MNYLKIKIEPIGCKHIHQQLEKAFISYMLGAWLGITHKQGNWIDGVLLN